MVSVVILKYFQQRLAGYDSSNAIGCENAVTQGVRLLDQIDRDSQEPLHTPETDSKPFIPFLFRRKTPGVCLFHLV